MEEGRSILTNFWSLFVYNPDKPVLFTGLYFWGFFAVLLLFYSLVYKKNHIRNLYLFALSLFFYYKSGGYFFSLLIISTLSDFFLAKKIHKASTKTNKKTFLVLSIIINLGMLAYFKYTYFLVDAINQLFGTNYLVLNILSEITNTLFKSNMDTTSILLPVGISFFTFQTISYSVDVYRGRIKPVDSITDFGFYVSFFPQLVAGPILRAGEFIPQLYQKFSLTKQEFWHATFLIISGLVKKIMISDYISVNFVDRVFDAPIKYTGIENLMAVYGYSIQIYCDFSGYTDIAIGLALILGFRLPINFNSPYKAYSLTDFWRRWHISLSQWLKDYLYIPLGGNRKGKLRTYVNLLITMLLGGLWHGASLKFIIWGGIHGAYLGIEKLFSNFRERHLNNKQLRVLFVILTFHVVSFTWIFFRGNNIESVKIMLGKIFTELNLSLLPNYIVSYLPVFMAMLVAYVIHWLPSGFKESYRGYFIKMPGFVKIVLIIVTLFFLYQSKSSDIQPFIYFKF